MSAGQQKDLTIETTDKGPKSTGRDAGIENMRPLVVLLGRLVWILVVLGAVALFVAGIPVWIANEQAQYRTQFGFWQISRNPAGEIVLIPDADTQAARSGVMAGDVLVSIEGQPPPAGTDLTEIALFPRGEAGKPLNFQVRTGDRPARDITLIRGDREGQNLARLGIPVNSFIVYTAGMEIFTVLSFLVVAGLIFWKRGDELIGWLASLMLIVLFASTISAPVFAFDELQPTSRYWLDVWNSLAVGLIILFMCLFPSGRFVPRWTRWMSLAWVVWAVAAWFVPELYFWRQEQGVYLLVGLTLLAMLLAAQVWRYRYESTTQEKQQTKWVVWGLGVALGIGVLGQILLGWVLPSNFLYDLLILPVSRLFQLLIPITLTVAIWRFRLWEIDLLINRTLVYGALTTLIIALYILIVGGLGVLFQTQSNALTGLIATGIIAVLFQPVRDRLQHGVNRLLYGQRDDPAGVLSQLAQNLETTGTSKDILPNLLQTIVQTLKIPYAAILLPDSKSPSAPIATYGKVTDQMESIPLTYRNEMVGQLLIAPRGPGEFFTPQERQLLNTIAALTAITVQAVQLSADLRRSRQRIVTAREEERRRLRRDLHDGLGPQLASQTLGLEAIDQLMEKDPVKAHTILAALKTQAQEAILDVRRLVYDLRPPALDDLGLVGALQQSAARYESANLRFHLVIPDELPELPAAVETATYRIVQEAMTNVVRHAQATEATVRLAYSSQTLDVEVSDNGQGLPSDHPAGVGLQSMRERAAELNGGCMVESLPEGGTRVRAHLPLNMSDE